MRHKCLKSYRGNSKVVNRGMSEFGTKNMSKPILFISHYCEHSKSILGLLNRRGIRPIFMIMNIDKHPHNLPSFLKTVPTIYTQDRMVLTDKDVFDYIDKIIQDTVQDIQPFDSDGMGTHASDQYSYIDNGQYSATAQRSFSLISEDETEFRILTLKEEDFNGSKSVASMDKLLQEREADIKGIMQTTAPDTSGQRNFRV
jgi:glutaredoxin-related protein